MWTKAARKIVAIGRNYAEHAKELGNAVPSKPLIFLKPTSSIIHKDDSIEIPKEVTQLHHEIELAVVIGKDGKNISAANAMEHVAGYSLSLDMTARNLQDEAKAKGHPWTIAKGYDTFTPMGDFIPRGLIDDPQDVILKLEIDGTAKQNGSTKDMIFPITSIIAHVSRIMTLEKGDIILTGTPSGVGPVRAGSLLFGTLLDGKNGKKISTIAFPVKDREEV